jgi:hypothetical protein
MPTNPLVQYLESGFVQHPIAYSEHCVCALLAINEGYFHAVDDEKWLHLHII